MSWIFVVIGLAIIGFTLLDLVMTTLTMEGAGPASNVVSHLTWKCFRLADRWLDSQWLRMLTGSVVLVVLVVFWLACTWLGWVLVFCWDGIQLINTATQQEASLVDRIYYVGYTITTVGYGDFRVLDTFGRLVSIVAGFTGLFLLTLAITYSIQVLTAVVEKRRLALLLDAMDLSRHETPAPPDERAQRIEIAADQLASLHADMAGVSQKYLAYPVIHAFNDRSPRVCLPVHISRVYTFLATAADSQDLSMATSERLAATRALIQVLIINAMASHWSKVYVASSGWGVSTTGEADTRDL
ncbi:MAG: potassium channel family protein [Pseudohongiella sp.]|uniref:potassium channel family protein n=1 Tax=Pseudohongiella sp. TaxID=1979412 RepID=UPI00349FE96B